MKHYGINFNAINIFFNLSACYLHATNNQRQHINSDYAFIFYRNATYEAARWFLSETSERIVLQW